MGIIHNGNPNGCNDSPKKKWSVWNVWSAKSERRKSVLERCFGSGTRARLRLIYNSRVMVFLITLRRLITMSRLKRSFSWPGRGMMRR